MPVMERLALLIDADGRGAVRELDKVGRSAERNLGRAEDKTDKWAQTFTSVGTKMVAASALVGAGLWQAAEATSDLNEAISQTDQVFGTAAAKVGAFAETATTIGQSERAAREAANTFGLFFEKADVSNDEAADMSITMTKLASDMASFKNTTPEEAVEALGAALRGESEPIRKYGVLLDDATLKQRAFDMGLVESTSGTLPPAIKMQAAYAEILEQTGTIQGDFVRTADGAANAQRVAAAEFENAKASIGEGFLPVMQAVVQVGGDAASSFAGLNDATGGAVSKMLAVGTVVSGVGGALLVAAGKAMELRKALIAAGKDGSKAALALQASLGPVVAITAAVAGGFAVWSAAMERGERQASNLGIEVENALLKADPEKLERMYAAAQQGIKDFKAESDGWNPLNLDYREDMKQGAEELEKQLAVMEGWRSQVDKIMQATGNSEANVLSWVKAQYEAGIVYESSTGALDAYRRAVEQSGAAVDTATGNELAFAEKMEESRDAIEDAIKAIDEWYGRLDAPGDLIANWEASMDSLQATLGENGSQWNYLTGQLDLGTEAGRANYEALKDARDAAVDMGQAVLDSGGEWQDASAKTLNYAGNLRQMLLQSGYSEEAVDSLIYTLGLTPEQVNTTFQQNGVEAAIANSAELDRQLEGLKRFDNMVLNISSRFEGFTFGSFFGGPRAAGGPVEAGGTYLVGEQGPELVTMGGNGHVTNARDTAAALSSPTRGGPTVVQLVVDGKVFTEQVVEPNLAKSRRSHTGSRRVG